MKKLYSVIFLVYFVLGSQVFADQDFFIKGTINSVMPQTNTISIRSNDGAVTNLKIQDYRVEIDGIRSGISRLKVGSQVAVIYDIDDDTNNAESVHIITISNN